MIHPDIELYHSRLSEIDLSICKLLSEEINRGLPGMENKIWHAHPVWFQDGNPLVGYDKLRHGIRLLFWSGQSFDEPGLQSEGSLTQLAAFEVILGNFTADGVLEVL